MKTILWREVIVMLKKEKSNSSCLRSYNWKDDHLWGISEPFNISFDHNGMSPTHETDCYQNYLILRKEMAPSVVSLWLYLR